jgi:radical SAM superfamily enzyme YgiQ (UPF0313 family)
VLLVNPWIYDFAAYDYWARPLGLLQLGAILRDHGCRVSWVDCLDRFHSRAPAPPLSARQGRGPYLKTPLPTPPGLADVPRTYSRYGIRRAWLRDDLQHMVAPDLILVTSLMTYWYPGVEATIEVLKSIWPEIPLLLGGVYATLCPEHAREHSGADGVIPGAAADRILDLVQQATGAELSPRYDLEDPNLQPFSALDLTTRISFAPLLTSTGCPFNCDYCASHFLAPRWRVQRPERIFREIQYWYAIHGVRDFAFYDDALLVHAPERIVPLLQRVVNAGLKLRFHTPNAVHIREITPDLARLLLRSGFHTLRLGLETADDDTGPSGDQQVDPKTSYREFAQAAAYLREAGFAKQQLGAYLLVGLPGQSLKDVRRAISAVHRQGVTPIPAYYSPIPHTALWSRAVAVSRYDLAADPIFSNNAVFPCWDDGFSWKTLEQIRGWVRGTP